MIKSGWWIGHSMRDGKTNTRSTSPILKGTLRALRTHRAWECPIHLTPGAQRSFSVSVEEAQMTNAKCRMSKNNKARTRLFSWLPADFLCGRPKKDTALVIRASALFIPSPTEHSEKPVALRHPAFPLPDGHSPISENRPPLKIRKAYFQLRLHEIS